MVLQKVQVGAATHRFHLYLAFGQPARLQRIHLVLFLLDARPHLQHVLVRGRLVLLAQDLVEEGWHRLAQFPALVLHGEGQGLGVAALDQVRDGDFFIVLFVVIVDGVAGLVLVLLCALSLGLLFVGLVGATFVFFGDGSNAWL